LNEEHACRQSCKEYTITATRSSTSLKSAPQYGVKVHELLPSEMDCREPLMLGQSTGSRTFVGAKKGVGPPIVPVVGDGVTVDPPAVDVTVLIAASPVPAAAL